MRQLNQIMCILMFVCISVALNAQNFHVLDVNKFSNSNLSNNSIFSSPWYDYAYATNGYGVLNGVAYVAADDGIHGLELWRSDGTTAGTWMVRDINPGSISSQTHDITIAAGKIYFSADDGVHGLEIWISDGTKQGTRMLRDIYPGIANASPSYLLNANGILYFFTNYASTADQLWKTDGTPQGTVKVTDFWSAKYNYAATANQLTYVNGHEFFVLSVNGDNELWKTDGTDNGTVLVKNINPSYSSNPSLLTPMNGKLYFSADDGTGRQLCVSDGTDAGTYRINNNNGVYLEGNTLTKFTVKNNSLYFTGYTNDGNGAGFCRYNPSNQSNNVEVVKVINPGYYSYNLYNIINVNGTLFFTVHNGIDQVLWKSDGTTAGTMELKNINPGGRNIYWYKNFVNANGTLLFSFYDDKHGTELWKSDGTEAGTVVVKELPGVTDPQAVDITYIGNNISVFQGTDGVTGMELWRTDGTSAGTYLAKDINKTTTGSSDPYALTQGSDNNKLFFGAKDYRSGVELRVTDGTEAGTHIAADVFKGSFNSYPSNIISSKKSTYFFAQILDTNAHGTSDVITLNRMFVTDGTPSGTKMLSVPALESIINGNGYIYAMATTNDLLYLVVFNYNGYIYELWRSDGTVAGTYTIKTDVLAYYSVSLKGVDNTLFFTNYDYSYGEELWKSDGTAAGTQMVKDIFPGYDNSFPANLTAFKGKLYFVATKDYSGYNYLWTSDGTAAGTKLVKPVAVSSSFPITSTSDKLFFYANYFATGEELWASDGTPAGTHRTKDIWPGYNSSYSNQWAVGIDSLLYFVANDGVNGEQLWKSNGTFNGTKMVANLGDNAGSSLYDFVNANGHFYFLNNGSLWKSDGTANGTTPVADANLADVTEIDNLISFGNKLVFIGVSPSKGKELFATDVSNPAISANNISEAESNTANLNAILYPNPVHDKAVLKISEVDKKTIVSITDMSGKMVWQNTYSNRLFINLPTEKLATGVYLVSIQSGSKSKTIKLVKE